MTSEDLDELDELEDPTTVVCPDCAGAGETFVDAWDTSSEQHYTIESRCEECDGTGEVEVPL